MLELSSADTAEISCCSSSWWFFGSCFVFFVLDSRTKCGVCACVARNLQCCSSKAIYKQGVIYGS